MLIPILSFLQEEKLSKLTLTSKLPNKVNHTIRESTNFLSIRSGLHPRRFFDTSVGLFKAEFNSCIFSSSVDKTLKIRSTISPNFDLLDTYSFTSPVLSSASDPTNRYIVVSTMEGSLSLIDLVTRKILQKVEDHTKYVVRVVWSADGRFVTSIGYDKGILIYEVVNSPSEDDDSPILLEGEEADLLSGTPKVELVQKWSHYAQSNPEAIIFLPESDYLVFTCREDNLIRYVALPGKEQDEKKDWEITSFNLNPNGDNWVSFSILYITIHPTLPILCLQTSTENSRLLLYPFHSAQRISTLFTTIEQGDYSTPRHCWLKDGTGVLLSSEDGMIRCIDMQGRIVLKLGAHGGVSPLEEGEEAEGNRSDRIKIRKEIERGSSVIKEVTVWESDKGELRFGSCGFDRTIRICEV